MTKGEPEKNDQARGRSDGNAPGEWPGSGTTVDGAVETATTGIAGKPDAGSSSTSGATIEPDDVPAEKSTGLRA